MDTDVLVENWVEFGREVLAQLTRDSVPFRVAFWVKTPDSESCAFYIVTDLPSPGATFDYLPAFYQSAFRVPKSDFSVGDIKILATSDPLAQAAHRSARQSCGGFR